MIEAFGLKTGVEIGTAEGWYSHVLLKQSSLNLLWSVDPYQKRAYKDKQQDAVCNLREFGDRSKMQHMTSIDAARQADNNDMTFDFIYIDGGHKQEDVRQDIDAWLPLISRPGIFAGHDYIANKEKWQIDVVPAVNDLAERLDMPLYLTAERWATWFFIFGE